MKNLRFLDSLLPALVAFALLMAGCSKSGADGETFHVTCTIDGTPTTLNAGTFGHIEYGSGFKSVTINGLTSLTNTAGAMGFIIINNPGKDSIVAGVYNDATTKFEVLASYSPNASAPDDYEAGTSFITEATNLGVSITNHFTASITAITATTIKGTFSGDFYFNGNANGVKKTITNGDFYVKIQ
jgi:hypothetical protein